MGEQDDKLKSDSRPSGLGPGERLQAARIQKSLSIEDVAGRMHLSTAILKAIEENRFDEITAPIFVKGYLRAYARIVSLDEDEIIRQYVDSYSEEDPPITTTSNMAPELSVADVRIKWTTYLVIVILAALLAAWWWNKRQAETAPISLDSQGSSQELVASEQAEAPAKAESEMATAAEDARQPAPEPEVAVAEPVRVEPPQAEPVAAEPAEAQPAAAETAAPEPAPVPAAEPVAEQPAGVADESPAQTGQSDAAAGDSEVAVAESAPRPLTSPALVAPVGDDRLEIVVIADTWADIKDGNDFQMVYDLLRADQTLVLTGAAPFSVFLGNGHGVEIRFNGEQIEFSARIRNDNTTRLRIGG